MTLLSRISAALGDRYRIEREVGAGAMAIVFLASDPRHGRQVALKVLRPELASALGTRRFLQEIRLTAGLQHPHILTLIDSGVAAELPYYVLPFVRGESLRDRLAREKQLAIDEAVVICRQVASALEYAHARGVVHRDVKPENILLHEGEAMLTDFGIALAVREAGGERLTESGVSVGTPWYMSPEQAAGDRDLDARSDVYALGAVMYEMLTGEPPHTGATARAVIARVLTVQPANPRVLRAAVPEHVDRAVMKALGKSPADRFRSAGEFGAALGAGGRNASAAAGAADAPRRRRRPSRALLAGGGLLAAAVLAALSVRLGARRTLARAAATAPIVYDRVQLTTTGHATDPVISRDGSQLAYLEHTCAGNGVCAASVVLRDLASSAEHVLVEDVGWGFPSSFSSDGAWLLIDGVAVAPGRPAGQYVVPRVGGPLAFVGAGRGDFVSAGDTVLIASAGEAPGTVRFRAVPLPVSELPDSAVHRSRGPLGEIDDSRVSPDGKRVAVLWERFSGEDVVVLYDRQGVMSDSTRVPPSAGFTLRWTPAGTAVLAHILSLHGDGALLRIAVTAAGRFGSRDTIVVAPGQHGTTRFDAATGGRGLVFETSGRGERTLWTMERSTPRTAPRPVRRARSTTAALTAMVTADGRTLAFGVGVPGAGAPRMQFFVEPFEGGAARALTPLLTGVLDWSPTLDGRRVIVATSTDSVGTRLTAYDVATGRGSPMVEANTRARLVAYGRDGIALLAATSDTIRLLDDQGHERARIGLPDSIGQAWAITGSPDGTAFAILALRPDTASGESGARQAFYRVSAAGGAVRLITWFDFGAEMLDPFQWTSDGWIYFGATGAGDRQPRLWRVRADGGVAHAVSALPFAGNRCFCVMSADGRRWAGVVSTPVSDIYLIRDLDLDRR